MYEELIRGLRDKAEFLWKASRYSSPHNSFAETMSQAADAIEELVKAKDKLSEKVAHWEAEVVKSDCDAWLAENADATRWIPVTEDLPVIDPEHHCSKDVIVRVEGGGYMFSALEENIFGQTWFECERMSPSGDDGYTVTHWMPFLPLPEDVE